MKDKIIVVADDEQSVRAIVSRGLADRAKKIIETEDGTGALAVSRAHRPDLVILDIRMPGLSGHDVCHALRADPETADIPILMLTGLKGGLPPAASASAGADDHLGKPFEISELLRRAEALMDRAPRRAPRPEDAVRLARVCAWCGADLGQGELSAAPIVSHGICLDCAFNMNAELGLKLKEYLDGLKTPVVVMQSDTTVVGANKAAEDALGKKSSDALGMRLGDVFQCKNARLPGGCGRTVHCGGCALRTTVEETLRTGKSREKVPAFLNETDQKVMMHISTEKVGGVVLLRVDGVEADGR
jgi:CheY-like chemotaxis protein